MNKWDKLASRLALSHAENLVLLAWRKDESSASCFDLFRVFKTHGFAQEANGLLAWALILQPDGTELLVNLAAECFEWGLVRDAWQCLQQDVTASRNHPKGLNTFFHCALVLGREEEAQSLFAELEQQNSFDPLGLKIGKTYKELGFEASRRAIQQRFEDRRITLNLEPTRFGASNLETVPFTQATMHWKDGICSLNAMGAASEENDFVEDRVSSQLWKKLERNLQSLEYLRLLKRQILKV